MNKILDFNIIAIGEFNLKIFTLIKLIIFLLAIYFTLLTIKKLLYRSKKIDIAKKYSLYNLIKYFVLVFTCITALQILGFNISVLLAGSAALLVGIGLGLQKIFSDFVSGIAILLESTVQVEDVIEVSGIVGKVKEINLRTTTVQTRDDKYLILPNSEITNNQLINWTHDNESSRFDVFVRVSFTSDIEEVMQILQDVVSNQEGVLNDPKPFVRLKDLGNSSLDFEIIFWTEQVFAVRNIQSDIRIKIFRAFQKHNITMPSS